RRLVQATRAGAAAAGMFLLATAAYLFTHYQAQSARRNFRRAEQAEQRAVEQLGRAYLAQARAGRRSGQMGHRLESLGAIAQAVAIGKPADDGFRLEMRNEAIAALALTDLRPVKAPKRLAGASRWLPFDASLERYLDFSTNGDLRIFRVADDQELL